MAQKKGRFPRCPDQWALALSIRAAIRRRGGAEEDGALPLGKDAGVRESGLPLQVLHLRRRAPPSAPAKRVADLAVVVEQTAAGGASNAEEMAAGLVRQESVPEARGPPQRVLHPLWGAPPVPPAKGRTLRLT